MLDQVTNVQKSVLFSGYHVYTPVYFISKAFHDTFKVILSESYATLHYQFLFPVKQTRFSQRHLFHFSFGRELKKVVLDWLGCVDLLSKFF